MLYQISAILIALASINLSAYDSKITVAKETKLVQSKPANKGKAASNKKNEAFKNYKPFTAKVLGEGVRLRLAADVESSILKELDKHELLVVKGEVNDFYAVEAPTDMKVYIFRSFVLDNMVEGNRVNVRLQPELTAPVVGFLSTGDRVDGNISTKNHKWLEFSPPNNVHFFIAKEYLEKVGGPELKALRDEKVSNLAHLVESAKLFAQAEMLKSYSEIDFAQVTSNFTEIINDYTEFPKQIAETKSTLAKLQEDFLKKKIEYLENKAMILSKNIELGGEATVASVEPSMLSSSKDRMKIWEKVEEALYVSWTTKHMNKSIGDYYEQQKSSSRKISGIVEAYTDSVQRKPGNFIIRDRDLPRAYVYSTMVDLQKYVGQYVTLVVAERPNNNFAFDAYFALEIE